MSGVEIWDSFSDGISIVAPGRAKGQGMLSSAIFEDVNVRNVGLGLANRPGLWIRKDVEGDLRIVRSQLGEVRKESEAFQLRRK